MKQYPYNPGTFDGTKFAKKYKLKSGLSPDRDFWADSTFIYLRDGLVLPDDPPVFEAPSPPPVLFNETDIDAANNILEIKIVLKRLLRIIRQFES